MQAPAGGAPGVRTQGRKGDDGSHTASPPPPPAEGQVPHLLPAPCLGRAYGRGLTARTPPPPPPSPPPTLERGEDSEETARGHGRGQRTDRHAMGRDGRRASETKKRKQRTKQTNVPGEESEEAGTNTATYGGRLGQHGPARDAGEVPDLRGMGAPKGKTPPPTAAKCLTPYLRRACVVPATCVLRREDDRDAPPPHTTAPPRVGDDGSGTRTPPEDKEAGWRGSEERVRDGPHDRAQREHAPCTPQRGDHRGCDRRVGRATTGATRQAPPPPAEGQVPCLIPAPCSRRAYARGQAARTPPRPTPFSSTHPRKGRGQPGDSEGTWGGAEDRPKCRGGRRVASGGDAKKKKKKKKGHRRARAGTNSRGRRDTAGARKHGKERRKGGHPWGRKLGGRDQHRSEQGGAGVTGARKRRW